MHFFLFLFFFCFFFWGLLTVVLYLGHLPFNFLFLSLCSWTLNYVHLLLLSKNSGMNSTTKCLFSKTQPSLGWLSLQPSFNFIAYIMAPASKSRFLLLLLYSFFPLFLPRDSSYFYLSFWSRSWSHQLLWQMNMNVS